MICRRGAVAAAIGFLLVPGDVFAQDPISLRMQPRIGDTLYLSIDQTMEMRGRVAERADSVRSLGSSLRVRARAIPTAVVGGATTMTTITDTLDVDSPALAPQMIQRARRSLEGKPVAIRVLPDGSMELLDALEHDDDASPLLGNMPALLPRGAVRVGDQWVREMRLPVRGSRGLSGFVRSTFRLDSLGRSGRIAYISVRGAFYERPGGGAGPERELEGSLAGELEFDRHLRWITDSRTTITMRSDLRPADPRLGPTAVWMRITQRLQARTRR